MRSKLELIGALGNSVFLTKVLAECALAVLEVAVHVPLGIIPINYFMMVIEIPDGVAKSLIDIKDLPAEWNSNPIVKASQYIGDDFLKSNIHLILQVPSATVPGDYNYIVNPRHPDFNMLKITAAEAFVFDSRLFKR